MNFNRSYPFGTFGGFTWQQQQQQQQQRNTFDVGQRVFNGYPQQVPFASEAHEDDDVVWVPAFQFSPSWPFYANQGSYTPNINIYQCPPPPSPPLFPFSVPGAVEGGGELVAYAVRRPGSKLQPFVFSTPKPKTPKPKTPRKTPSPKHSSPMDWKSKTPDLMLRRMPPVPTSWQFINKQKNKRLQANFQRKRKRMELTRKAKERDEKRQSRREILERKGWKRPLMEECWWWACPKRDIQRKRPFRRTDVDTRSPSLLNLRSPRERSPIVFIRTP